MTTPRHLIAIGSAALLAALPASAQAQGSLKILWELTEGVQAPESAYYDAKSGSLFISQLGAGGGKTKDGDGWITKMTLDGKVVTAKWFKGLHSPKGLRSTEGTLWVSDIDRIVAINIDNGKTRRVLNVPGAKFLNDVAADSRGTIYVSDMEDSAIYKVRGDKVSLLAKGPELESPNGLLVVGNTLLIAGWGRDLNDSFDTVTPGRLLSYDLRTRQINAITETPTGNLDGVELDGMGGYFVTDWMAGSLFHITSKGAVTSLLDLPKGCADLAYLPEKKLLILPRMEENRVTAYDLSGFKP